MPQGNTGYGDSSTGSTTPSRWGHQGLRWGRSLPRAPMVTTPPITTVSIPGSVTTPTSTTSLPRRTAAGCAILLDGVFNHVGVDFPRYREAPDNEASARWFRGRRGRFHTFEGHSELITLNHDNPEVVDYAVDVMAHWLRRGADGWRLDAAYAVRQEFWSATLPRVRELYPGCVVRRRADPWRLCGGGRCCRVRLGHPVRAVEGDLEQPQRRQLLRTGLGIAAPQQVPGQFRAADIHRQSRRHPHRQPARELRSSGSMRW